MYRVGLAGFIHETNTFSETPTPLEAFINQSGFYPELRKGAEILKFKEGRLILRPADSWLLRKILIWMWCPWCGAGQSLPSLYRQKHLTA